MMTNCQELTRKEKIKKNLLKVMKRAQDRIEEYEAKFERARQQRMGLEARKEQVEAQEKKDAEEYKRDKAMGKPMRGR